MIASAPPIENLALTEHIVKTGDGTIENSIDVWFTKPQQGSYLKIWAKSKIYLSDDDGSTWIGKGETADGRFNIMGGLSDGGSYKVRATSIAYDGKETALADAPESSITIIGKSALPTNVSGFIVRQSRDRLVATWNENPDVDIWGYEIRKGASWEAGSLMATGITQTNFISLYIAEGIAINYWIKAIDTSGNYSETATQAILTIDNVPFTNILESYSEHTAWAGTKTDLVKDGDNLKFATGELLGTYLCPVRDIGFLATFKIGINEIIVATGDATWQDFGDQIFSALPDSIRFSGAQQSGAVAYEIRTSEDNVTWTDFSAWILADYRCRYFQIRMTIARANASIDLECSSLEYYADLPDIDENQEATISDGASGVAITFEKTFHKTPSVNVTIASGGGVYHVISSLSTTGATIKLYDQAGAPQTGDIIIHIHGI